MDITELGAGALFAYIIIKEVLAFLRHPKVKEEGTRLSKVEAGVQTLVEQHAVKDADGRLVWWNRRETYDQLDKVSDSLAKCIELVRETHHKTQTQIQETHGLLREMLIRMGKSS